MRTIMNHIDCMGTSETLALAGEDLFYTLRRQEVTTSEITAEIIRASDGTVVGTTSGDLRANKNNKFYQFTPATNEGNEWSLNAVNTVNLTNLPSSLGGATGYQAYQPYTINGATPLPLNGLVYRSVGQKYYELKDHLGNVRVVVSDRKDLNTTDNSLAAHVVSYNNYYPFGMPQPNRNFDSQEYRYGFQGQEKDSELKGEGNSINYKYRMYDTRIGRFFATDPLESKYPFYSPYQFAGNNVIQFVELEGLEPGENANYYGEIRVAPVTGSANIHANLRYWMAIEMDFQPLVFTETQYEWIEQDMRPVEIVYEMDDYEANIPWIYTEEGKDEIVWNRMMDQMRGDPVEDPAIAATGIGNFNGGRYGCTRSGADPNNLCSTPGRRFHDGTDVQAEVGLPMYAVLTGEVTQVRWAFNENEYAVDSYGNYIEVTTTLADGRIVKLRYNHLNGVGVKRGDNVIAGENIGTTGATGNAASNDVPNKHIHIKARVDNQRSDPEEFIESAPLEDGTHNGG